MDREQLTTLKQRIEEELQTLESKLQRNDDYGLDKELVHDSLGELSSYDNHPADHGTETFERSKDLALWEHDRHHRDDLESALKRMDEGTYGTCETCGKEIPFERLLAVPDTRYCVTHAREQNISDSRPVEEEILDPSFKGTNPAGRRDNVGFDGSDSWNAVAKYGTSNPPGYFRDGEDYDELTVEEQNDSSGERGYVEKVEAFVATDMDGGEGDDVEILKNEQYEDYVEEIDEEEQSVYDNESVKDN